jgi:hypothetical protein
LAITANQQRRDINTEPGTIDYTSNALKLFAEDLQKRPQGQVLDVGPACQENIIFFTGRVKRLYICDMFLRLMRCLDKKHPVSQIWKYLDYPPESFDGILLWELADRLDDKEVSTLAKLCHKILKPGGMAVVLVLGEQAASSVVNSFVIGQDFRVRLRPQTHLHLPLRGRQNRDVLTTMAPLTPAKSFICRPGFMEFLFRRDA